MGLFNSVFRFVSSIFGLVQGGTERTTDKMLTSSPDIIRNQYRKTREDWTHEYNEMRDAIAQLCQIRDGKVDETKKLTHVINDVGIKMQGAIVEYKNTQNEAVKELYVKFASAKEDAENKIKELALEIKEQEELISTYKTKLMSLKTDIENLKKEEAETVADIISSKKMKELNNKLQGMANDTQSKNLEAIREARKQLKSAAKLSVEMSGLSSPEKDLESKLITSGKSTKFLTAFDEATKLDRIFVTPQKVEMIPDKTYTKMDDMAAIPKDKTMDAVLDVFHKQQEREKSSSKLDDLFS